MISRIGLWIGFTAVVISLSGCMQRLSHPSDGCQAFLEDLTAQVRTHTHFEPDTHRIAGQPLLRSNRFLASFDYNAQNPEQRQAWLNFAFDIALTAWQVEFQRLPDREQQRLRENHQFNRLDARLTACYLQQSPPRALAARDVMPDDSYSSLLRVFGLYPLTSRLAMSGIENYRAEMTERYHAQSQQNFARKIRYQPGVADPRANLPTRFTYDPLGIPLVSENHLEALFIEHAPVLVVEQQSPADQVGLVALSENGNPTVDTLHPVSYTYHDHTRWQGKVLLRLNYVFWFPARPAQSRFDIYAGALDSVVWRVTLVADGQAILFDTIHSCGCYHKLFLPEASELTLADLDGEKPLVFKLAHANVVGAMLSVDAVNHYVVDVDAAVAPEPDVTVQPYGMLRYRALLSLPGSKGRQSLFAANGLVPASKRLERFLFWPLGIPSAGTMRQRGTQATAFIGRRHFDDPFLLDQLGLVREQ